MEYTIKNKGRKPQGSSKPFRGGDSRRPKRFGAGGGSGSSGSSTGGYKGSNPVRSSSGGYKGSNPVRSSAGGRGKFAPRRNFSGGGGGKKTRGEFIDASRFISRAEIVAPEEIVTVDHKFEDFAFDAELKDAIRKKGFVNPTPIQDKVIPHILKGKDVVGLANTGTGKTAAFLLPLITKVRLIPEEKVLILAPTRELAIQIASELQDFTYGSNIYSTYCVGGMHIGRQIDQLRRQNHFVIGTPGRIKDLIQRGMIETKNFSTIVLDEADRMLDMGFIEDMRWILSGFPKNRQTLFFSATLSTQIEKLVHDFLQSPEIISVRKRETSKNIDQDVIRVGISDNKIEILGKMLNEKEFEKVIIFGRTKRGVEVLSRDLFKRGFKVESIHGDKNHSQRQRALKSFKENKSQILVATDVAARGLDIPNVTHVINFDIPQTYDDYVHRIGRTGRGESTGKAFTFIEHKR